MSNYPDGNGYTKAQQRNLDAVEEMHDVYKATIKDVVATFRLHKVQFDLDALEMIADQIERVLQENVRNELDELHSDFIDAAARPDNWKEFLRGLV